jgi:hypothetical protein
MTQAPADILHTQLEAFCLKHGDKKNDSFYDAFSLSGKGSEVIQRIVDHIGEGELRTILKDNDGAYARYDFREHGDPTSLVMHLVQLLDRFLSDAREMKQKLLSHVPGDIKATGKTQTVYLLCEHLDGNPLPYCGEKYAVKVGFSKCLTKRMKKLQTGNPRKLQALAAISGVPCGKHSAETLLKQFIGKHYQRISGEWYLVDNLNGVTEGFKKVVERIKEQS